MRQSGRTLKSRNQAIKLRGSDAGLEIIGLLRIKVRIQLRTSDLLPLLPPHPNVPLFHPTSIASSVDKVFLGLTCHAFSVDKVLLGLTCHASSVDKVLLGLTCHAFSVDKVLLGLTCHAFQLY